MISVILTYFIYFLNREDKLYIMNIGDGIASGETSYNIDGISYNDYIKEYYTDKNLIKEYNDTYSYKNYKIKDLLYDIDNNVLDSNNDLFIKQIIHKANIIIINIGEDELTKLAITNDLDISTIKEFINNFDELLDNLSDLSEAKKIVIGYYENNNLAKSDVIVLNSEIANLCNKYESIFIDISDIIVNKEYFLSNNSYYFNYKAHKLIAEMIIHSL